MRPPPKTVAHQRAQTIRTQQHPRAQLKPQAAPRGYFAVCLAIPEGRVSRSIGDNRGAFPAFLIATTDKRDQNSVIKKTNEMQPYIRFRVVEKAVVDTREHMERLKAALDEMLLGHQELQDNIPPLGRYRDITGAFDERDERGISKFWADLLVEALRVLAGGARHFDVYDDAEWERRATGKRP